ncbi:MAG: hypothetical protein CMQ40_10140 [Gammaproteobacteria bacterium]|nr:hypothetical protein [Gammaproteobacteria bacterium]
MQLSYQGVLIILAEICMYHESDIIQIFAKTPIPGRVKTRLIPLLGDKGACDFHKRMITKLVNNLSESYSKIEIWTDFDTGDHFLNGFGFPVVEQIGKDLGEKMINALNLGLVSNEKVALIGTDLPQMSSAYVRLAFKQLDKYPVVLGPTYDGGFGLISVRHLSPSIFEEVLWGREDVLEKILRNIASIGSNYFLLSRILDVDTPEDYRRYQLFLNDV